MSVLASIDLQTLGDAFGLGAIYALMAVGIGLVFGVLRLVNFAYGQLVMAGAYTLAFTSGWPIFARGLAYATIGTAVEYAGCQIDRKLLAQRSGYSGGAFGAGGLRSAGCRDDRGPGVHRHHGRRDGGGGRRARAVRPGDGVFAAYDGGDQDQPTDQSRHFVSLDFGNYVFSARDMGDCLFRSCRSTLRKRLRSGNGSRRRARKTLRSY